LQQADIGMQQKQITLLLQEISVFLPHFLLALSKENIMTIPQPEPEQKLLQTLVGEKMSSVEFVMDYVQLRFASATLTCVTLPALAIAGRRWSWGDSGYNDQLIGRIDHRVKAVSIKHGDSITITLDDDSVIQISLKDNDYVTAEAARFQSVSGAWWVL
jgi:hypothetical protein